MDIIHGDDLVNRLDELIERAAADERIILSHAGKQVAIVSFDDLTFLEDVDRKLDQQDAQEALHRLSDPAQTPIPFLPTSLTEQSTQH